MLRCGDGIRGVVPDPGGGGVGDVRAVARAGDDVAAAAYGVIVSFGAKGNDVIAGDISRGEFFRTVAELKGRLLVSEEDIIGITGRIVAKIHEIGRGNAGLEIRWAEAHLAVQVNAAIQFDESVGSGGIAVDQNVEWRVGDDRNFDGVSEVGDIAFAGRINHVAVGIHAAAHLEGKERAVIGLAIRTVMAINQ